ncbi:RbsD/FucU family protein [Pelagovum pacificum]|uniref:Ribose ABC transporter n=1 Tax=Pelagovum pacificum TaxID=2588711 RepID=A0A5C5GEC9_9RHOB|nr:RbsD/FucU family protein [Pelagovum pacificum]QQA43747.1 RbsD/FucU family protein [Pelagovum pacificum]TNY33122.1 ribose ABC transporter [Pelagovum pacificum]
MLRNIPPILSPDLLHALAAMGHGDDIVLGDANFPASSLGPTAIRLDGLDATDVLQAVLSLMPLDNFVPDPALTMQVVGKPDEAPPIFGEFQKIIDETADHPAPIASLERFDFYQRASEAFVIVQTGETRLYGNIILKKGVIG